MMLNPFPGVSFRQNRTRVLNVVLLFGIAFSLSCSDRREIPSAEAPSVAPILLFGGTGTSPGDVAAFETVLQNSRLDYNVASSSMLNKLSEAQMQRYRLLIFPGGNFIDIGNDLSRETTKNIRNAVHNGVNYLGVCAGAFLAGDLAYNSLNLTSGVRFGFYSAENHGIRKTAVTIASPEAPTLDQYWEDGPQLTGWGTVVGKYPDGTPAVVEGTFGNGWVILAG